MRPNRSRPSPRTLGIGVPGRAASILPTKRRKVRQEDRRYQLVGRACATLAACGDCPTRVEHYMDHIMPKPKPRYVSEQPSHRLRRAGNNVLG